MLLTPGPHATLHSEISAVGIKHPTADISLCTCDAQVEWLRPASRGVIVLPARAQLTKTQCSHSTVTEEISSDINY